MYSVAAISLAATYFGSDAVLYRNDILWSDMLRRPRIPRERPTTGEALMTLVTILPLNILATHLLARWVGKGSPMGLILGMSVITLGLFAGIPLLAAWLGRLRLRTTFAWHAVHPGIVLAGACMGLSLTPLLIAFLKGLGFLNLSEDKLLEVQELVREFQQVPSWVLVLALAVIPAICEELFFRGFLYTAVAADGTPAKAMFISSVLFGLFHVLGGAIAVERFLPSAMIGFVLAWLRLRSGSILPGIVLHAVHNGAIAVVAANEKWLSANGFGNPSAAKIVAILAISTVLVAGAVMLVRSSTRGTTIPQEPRST
jgi:sodium transport system permease protein